MDFADIVKAGRDKDVNLIQRLEQAFERPTSTDEFQAILSDPRWSLAMFEEWLYGQDAGNLWFTLIDPERSPNYWQEWCAQHGEANGMISMLKVSLFGRLCEIVHKYIEKDANAPDIWVMMIMLGPTLSDISRKLRSHYQGGGATTAGGFGF